MTPAHHCTYQYRSLSETAPAAVGPLPVPEPDRCPHSTVSSDDDRCLFHTTEREYPPSAIGEAFLDAVSNPDREATFAGGRVGSLDLSETVLETPNGEPIDLRGTTIDGDLDLSGATVTVPLLLGNAAITGALDARGAQFERVVDLAGAKIGRQALLARAQFDAGVVANGLDAGFVDARTLSVDGPAVFDDASFSANVRFARSQFDGTLSCEHAQWRGLADFAMITVAEETSFDGSNVGGEFRLTGATVNDELSMASIGVDGDVRCCHAGTTGSLDASGATFAGEADFDDFQHHGATATFDHCTFEAETSFSFAGVDGSLSFADGTFEDEVWFTYGHFGGTVTFDGARFEDLTHVRDATFESDVTLRSATSEAQLFFHGSTIGGDVDARAATIDHFQFGAELDGNADFSAVHFDGQAIFARSEFGGRARFDSASFAGDPDFTGCQFLSEVSFEGTEFLVSPTFDDARFAVELDLDAADLSRSIEANDDQGPLIVARPEELANVGTVVPLDALRGEIVVPAHAAPLIEPNAARTKALAAALEGIDRATWYDLFDRSIKLARTAAIEFDSDSGDEVYVFGFSVDADAERPDTLVRDTSLVAAYAIAETESQIKFSHLDSELERYDHLVSVSGSAAALSDVSVATHNEFRTAILRRLMMQLALDEQRDDRPQVHQDSLPAVVGIAHLDTS